MGKGFRIGHMGEMNERMPMVPLNGAEVAMKDLEYAIELGSGCSCFAGISLFYS